MFGIMLPIFVEEQWEYLLFSFVWNCWIKWSTQITLTFKTVIGLSMVLFLSLFAKPSFLQSFGPAFAFLLIYYLFKSKGKFIKEFSVFCVAAVLPFLYLIRQFLFYFSTSNNNPGMMIERQNSGILIFFAGFSDLMHVIDCQFCFLGLIGEYVGSIFFH